jgi:hypothetical protein
MQRTADLQNAMSLAHAFERRISAAVTVPSLSVARPQQRL